VSKRRICPTYIYQSTFNTFMQTDGQIHHTALQNVCGCKVLVIVLPTMQGDQIYENTNNGLQYVKKISVEPLNLPCSVLARLTTVSLRFVCGKTWTVCVATYIPGFCHLLHGWRCGCSNLQIFGTDCFQYVCHLNDCRLTFTVICPVMGGEG
jgi:hypothetical protein